MACIISMIVVIIHNVCRFMLAKHLLIDTLVNALVYRTDLLINLISILYSTPSFKKHYARFCGICDSKIKKVCGAEQKMLEQIVTPKSTASTTSESTENAVNV